MSSSPSTTTTTPFSSNIMTTPNIHIQVLGRYDNNNNNNNNNIPNNNDGILTRDALQFVGLLCSKFEYRRQLLLQERSKLSTLYDTLQVPTFLNNNNNNPNPNNKNNSNNGSFSTSSSWTCAPIPSDVQDRRVEITGPANDRKMVINGLNSGANVYMADMEDSASPTWDNIVLDSQQNLKDAVRRTIRYTNPHNGRTYQLHPPSTANKTKTAVLFVRPRGWHLDEAHILVNGQVASGSIVDFALYLYHNAYELMKRGSGPYFYLPKLEGRLEARLWNDIFLAAQDYLGIPRGTIRATVLLETITAAYEMEEILYELRHHSLGLNCGRWDYLFSYMKKFKFHSDKIMPDRQYLTMDIPMMKAYVSRLIYICHKRQTFAMGGMSAAIPIKDDPIQNSQVMSNIRADKLREVTAGHDGTWVAHPALVKVAKDVFDKHMKTPNQIDTKIGFEDGRNVRESDLLQFTSVPSTIPHGKAITSEGLIKGISIVLTYTEAWLRGIGCIPISNHMEDAATAEISRVQIWQWRYHGVCTQDDNVKITSSRIQKLVRDEVKRNNMVGGHNKNNMNNKGRKWLLAGKLVEEMLTKEKLDDFLTTVCYPYIVKFENVSSLTNSRL